jgi:CRISPR/Cas system-associated exonuclease Cas4 (RecB family)
MTALTNQLFLTGTECSRKAWLVSKDGAESQWQRGRRFEDTRDLLLLAQKALAGGFRVEEEGVGLEERLAVTRSLVERPEVQAIFNGWFSSDGLVGRADILIRTGKGWTVKMVKASAAVKGRQVEELSYVVGILKHCGLKIDRCLLGLVNKGYVWKGGQIDASDLIYDEDVTLRALKQVGYVSRQAKRTQAILAQTSPPQARRKSACRECSRQTECWGEPLSDFDIVNFPGYRREFAEEMEGFGITDVRDLGIALASGVSLTESQARHHRRALIAQPRALEGLAEGLASIRQPALYIDFEVDQPAFPWVEGSHAYEAIPFQHHAQWGSEEGLPGESVSFLWPVDDIPGSTDPRPGFVATLLEPARRAGSILVYSDFEWRMVRELADRGVPGAHELLDLLNEKMVDLQEVVRRGLEHPGFLAGLSIKTVLPALLPDGRDPYADLAVRDGDMAVDAFRILKDQGADPAEQEKTAKELKEYCALDVRSMIDVVRELRRFSPASSSPAL